MKEIQNINFKGTLQLGGHLSKNFEKSVPELNNMIKDKPYDVFVRGSMYRLGKRRKIITRFHANNYGYLTESKELNYMDTYSKKARHGSYKSALQKLITQMDEKIAMQKASQEEPTLKEKFKVFMTNLYLRMFTE